MRRETRPLKNLRISLALGAALLLARTGLATDVVLPAPPEPKAEAEKTATTASDKENQKSEADTDPGSYVPPRWGAPRAKVGGGLRYGPQGTFGSLPATMTLAPSQLARTISPSPALFWHIDSVPGPDMQVVFYLTDYNRTEPVAEITLEPPQRAGIQRIDLARHGVELEVGVEYDWAVALVVDPERRSRDVIANAYIERVPAPVAFSGARCDFGSCVELGLWYDALAAISDAIEAAPENAALREQRRQLLSQAGLEAAIEGSASQAR